jgi:uncharacterized delta-60 repeat protein
MQPDGKVVVAGGLTWLAGKQSLGIGRLNADGSFDAGFSPGTVEGQVHCVAAQGDGKIVIGGAFSSVGGRQYANLARLNPDGTLDATFNPRGIEEVFSLAVQTDGKILVGGLIDTQGEVGPVGWLNPDGTIVDTGFNPQGFGLTSLALQANGMILLGGDFTWPDGSSLDGLARLMNTELGAETLNYDASMITWLRSGASPEVWFTTFEFSTGGTNWTMLGGGSRIPGGWQISGASIPPGATIRARGYYSTGQYNGSGSIVETLLSIPAQSPPCIVLDDGHFGFGTNGFGFDVSATAGQVVAVDCSSNLVNWLPFETNIIGNGPFYFSDPAAKAEPPQFYRARIVP